MGDHKIVAAVTDQAEGGSSYRVTSPLEIELGGGVARTLPSLERIRFVNSGTEATMSAIRAVRAIAKRDPMLKFESGYRDRSDRFLVQTGSRLANLGMSSVDVPEAVAHSVRMRAKDFCEREPHQCQLRVTQDEADSCLATAFAHRGLS
jgi:glutamate-1-semialdehyde 2,1-aminomutase